MDTCQNCRGGSGEGFYACGVCGGSGVVPEPPISGPLGDDTCQNCRGGSGEGDSGITEEDAHEWASESDPR